MWHWGRSLGSGSDIGYSAASVTLRKGSFSACLIYLTSDLSKAEHNIVIEDIPENERMRNTCRGIYRKVNNDNISAASGLLFSLWFWDGGFFDGYHKIC